MILADQPTCFGDDVIAAVSSRDDGTMLDRTRGNRHDEYTVEHRRRFCRRAGFDYDDCVYQIISYADEATFDRLVEVDQANTDGAYADVLYTETSGVGLFLPIADCVGTIVYDPVRRALAMAHLGRHASVTKMMRKTIEHFVRKGSRAGDLIIWMSPSVAQADYRMDYFDHADDLDWQEYAASRADGVYLDIAGFNRALAVGAGVPSSSIHVSIINTAHDPHYFSHSQGDTTGRFAVLAAIR
ncbi:hypothetical protein CR983_02580 [Candidatus Saccharibacteria bacterium]|nr:MAG: hypothetical protein CR983_02580 [Candidatus Saccharibacteria bacterium]